MSPLVPHHGLALSLYIVYIETVIYISACLKYCINVNLPTEGEGMAALLAAGARGRGVRGGACVCACDTATLQPSSSIQQKHPPKKTGEPGWVERGMGLGMAEEDPLCSPPPCPWLTPSGMHPALLTRMSLCCLVVARGLAGGCHIAQIQTVLGAAGCAGIAPGSTLCPAGGGTAQLLSGTCLAWERGGSVSFKR